MEDRSGINLSEEKAPTVAAQAHDGAEEVLSGAEDRIAVPLSFEEYQAMEARRKRVRTHLIWSGVILATIAIPIIYLQIIGQFSTANLVAAKALPGQSSLPGGRKGSEPAVYGTMKEPKRTAADQARFDRLKSDLSNYVSHGLKQISPDEKIALIGFANVTGRNFKDNATTASALRKDVIPAEQKLVADARALHPETDEVRAVNALLLRSAQMRLLAYQQMLSGADDPEGLWKYAFDAEVKDAEDNARAFHTQLTQLTGETGVALAL